MDAMRCTVFHESEEQGATPDRIGEVSVGGGDTASTVLGLVLVLAILLSAVLVLGPVLDRQSTWHWQVLGKVLVFWGFLTFGSLVFILNVFRFYEYI